MYKRDAKSVRQSTYTRLCRTITNQIIPTIGDLRLNELTASIIQARMVNALLNEDSPWTGKPLAPSTVEKTVIHLKDCLEQAVEDRLICAKVKKPTRMRDEKPHEMRFLQMTKSFALKRPHTLKQRMAFPSISMRMRSFLCFLRECISGRPLH